MRSGAPLFQAGWQTGRQVQVMDLDFGAHYRGRYKPATAFSYSIFEFLHTGAGKIQAVGDKNRESKMEEIFAGSKNLARAATSYSN